nr:alanine racemase [Nakamurella aerolata]
MLGRPIDELPTPAPLVDLDVFDANARVIADRLTQHGMSWRPHSKAHKSPQLAKRQLALGAVGITCAKLGEAEVMTGAGIDNILVANMLATADKWRRAAEVQRTATVAFCVDDERHVRMASHAAVAAGTDIGLFIEVDIGMHRVGVRGPDAAVRLAELIAAAPGVRLAGMMGYEGHLPAVWPAAEKTIKVQAAVRKLTGAADRVRAAGHQVPIVSSGGTATYQSAFGVEGLTESQSGGGCLMDRFYLETCHVELPVALTLAATVVSAAEPGVAITDAGFKALGSLGSMLPPLVAAPSGVTVSGLSAEHGLLAAGPADLRVGDRVTLIPGYSDAMIFLHDKLYGHRGGVVTEVIDVAARGRLQ